MRQIWLLAFLASCAWAQTAEPEGHEFVPPGPGDVRSPCPWMNSLANHGFLNRNGQNISFDDLTQGFLNAMNFQPGIFDAVSAGVISTGDNVTFNLDQSVKHNVIEHDASLSRDDTATGDALNFNAAIWNQTLTHFPDDIITIKQAAEARAARISASRLSNPEFNLTVGGANGSFGENMLYMMLFGDPTSDVGTANKQFLRILVEQDRIPYQEGFVRSEQPLTTAQLLALIEKMREATIAL
ncbi:Cloroperoxidase [Thozetella sp. PMI_491]|nr:Cloroperoxidase [Thozetella sp. PMI_491]